MPVDIREDSAARPPGIDVGKDFKVAADLFTMCRVKVLAPGLEIDNGDGIVPDQHSVHPLDSAGSAQELLFIHHLNAAPR